MDVEHRAARGPGPFREPCAQALQDLPCAPSVSLVLSQNEIDQLGRRLVWTRSGRPGVVQEPTYPALAETVEPLVAGDSTDAVPDESSLIAQWPLSTSFTKRRRSSTGLVSNLGIPHPPKQAREVLAMCPDTCKLCTRVVPLGGITTGCSRRRLASAARLTEAWTRPPRARSLAPAPRLIPVFCGLLEGSED